jgi:5-(carboxyamino)imidazole ribonucleotide synthase
LIRLLEEGKRVFPDPNALRIIQDKGLQKSFLLHYELPTATFFLAESKEQLKSLIISQEVSFPFIQKSRKLGYDGKGVRLVESRRDLHNMLPFPCLIEEKVVLQKEISVIAARDQKGNIRCYPAVEMVFNKQANLVQFTLSPAKLKENIAQMAYTLAEKTISAFGIVGLLAVEMFLDENNRLFINEVAPRPHNSGHHTIESAYTSQYEQHLRALLGLPLGSPKLLSPSVMINLIGGLQTIDSVSDDRLIKCMEIEGVKVHLYGKKENRPFRKMGHITILEKDKLKLKQKTDRIIKLLNNPLQSV